MEVDGYILGEPIQKWKITYLDYDVGHRVHYMQTAWIRKEDAEAELGRIKRDRTKLIKNGYKSHRNYFKVVPTMVRPIISRKK
jgi:hypothetical protein